MATRKEILTDILWKLNDDNNFRAAYASGPESALKQYINPDLSEEETRDLVKTVEVREDIRVKVGGPWFKACTA